MALHLALKDHLREPRQVGRRHHHVFGRLQQFMILLAGGQGHSLGNMRAVEHAVRSALAGKDVLDLGPDSVAQSLRVRRDAQAHGHIQRLGGEHGQFFDRGRAQRLDVLMHALHHLFRGERVLLGVTDKADAHGADAHMHGIAPGPGHARHLPGPAYIVGHAAAAGRLAQAFQDPGTQGIVALGIRAARQSPCLHHGHALHTGDGREQLQLFPGVQVTGGAGLHGDHAHQGAAVGDDSPVLQGILQPTGLMLQQGPGRDHGAVLSGEDHVARGRGGRQTGEVPDPGPALHVFALGRVHKNLQVEPGQHAVQRMTGPGPDFCQHRQHGAAEQRGAIQQAARKITGDALVQTGKGRTVPSHGSLLCLQPDAYRLGLLIIVGETPLAARVIAAGGLHGHTDTQVPWLHTLHADTQGADMPLPGQPGQRLFRILPGTGHHAIQIFLPPEQPEPGADALQRLLALGIGQAVSPPASPVAGHAHTLIGQGIVVMCPCVRKQRDDHRRHQAIVALQVGQRPGEQSVEQAVLLVKMQTDIHAILPRGWPSYRSRPVRPYAHAGSGRRHRHCFADPAKPRCRR
nr:MAG TPA: hypothetical protein [Caudoviricetes sp.]